MKNRLLLLILTAIFFTFVSSGTIAYAKSYTAEQLVVQAERYANQLKNQVYYGKPKKLGLASSSLISKTLSTKKQALASVKKLKSTSSRKKLEARLNSVQLIYSRAVSYNDAVLAGQKLKSKTQSLQTTYKINPKSDQTKMYYLSVQVELKKFPTFINKVYGHDNQTALINTYKVPADRALIQTKSAVSPEKIEIDFDVVEAIIHPIKPIFYALSNENELVEINFKTNKVRKMSFSLPAERLYFANNELYVTLLKGQHSRYWWEEDQKGAFAIVNPDSLTIKEMVDIPLDPFDIVADSKSIYISGGSGQWTHLKVYSRRTLLETDNVKQIYEKSFLDMHSNDGKVYAVDSDISPRDVKMYQFADGKCIASYDSPYHGDYPLKTNMSLSPDGKYIFNGSGVVLKTAVLKQFDMNYVTKLYNPYEEIAFDLPNNRLYSSSKNGLDIYDYSMLKRIKQYQLNHDIDFMFVQENQLIVVYKETAPDTLMPKQVVKKYFLNNQGTLIF